MIHVLDTDIMTLYQHGHEAVARNILAHPISDLAVTVISVEEELTGWYTKLRRARDSEQLARAYQRMTDAVPFFARFRIYSFTQSAIGRYENLRSLHKRSSKNDLRIAAIAIENGATLVTRNTVDFKHIVGLTLEDWSV